MDRYHRADYRYYQGGHGLGSFLAGIFRQLVPVLGRAGKSVAKQAIKAASSDTGQALKKTAAKNLKSAVIKGGVRALRGENVLEGAKQDLATARKQLAQQLDKAIDNGGGSKKNKSAVKRKAAEVLKASASPAPAFGVAKKPKLVASAAAAAAAAGKKKKKKNGNALI